MSEKVFSETEEVKIDAKFHLHSCRFLSASDAYMPEFQFPERQANIPSKDILRVDLNKCLVLL